MKWFYHIRVSHKLLLVFTVICLSMGAVGYLGLTALSKMNRDISDMYNQRLVPVMQLMQANKAISENAVILMNSAQMNVNMDGMEEEIAQNMKMAEDNIAAYSKNDLTKEEKSILDGLTTLMTAYKSNMASMIEATKSTDKTSIMLKLNGSMAQKKALEDSILALVDIQNKRAESLYQASDRSYRNSQTLTIGIMAGAIVLAILFAILLTRMIARPINQVRSKLAEISRAGGDLTQRLTVHSRDEVGQLAQEFNSMMESIQGIISQVLYHAKLVATTSVELTERAVQTSKSTEEIAFAMKEIASGADMQVQSITETSVSMNQMSAGVQQISANSQEVSSTSVHATEIARKGRDIIDHSMAKIETVTSTVTESAELMKQLGTRSQEISKIVDVITGIANQTNLLALNAAIEAARAAEHGRGFAVVADEVRKLAEESGRAAKQIAVMVEEIQQETNKVSAYMVNGTDQVQEGLSAAREAKEAFEKIHDAIETVTRQITEVSAATEQMAAGTEDVLNSVQTIVQIAETATDETSKAYNSAEDSRSLMDQIVSSSNAMSEMAEQLQRLVGQFKV